MFKKIGACLLSGLMFFGVVGCSNQAEHVEGKLEDIMTTIYTDIPENERPMMLMNTELNEENVEYYLGTTDIPFTEGLASESGVGSIAHSVVLIRVKDGSNISDVVKKIEDSVDPRKWICVEAEKVVVESKGDLILLVMSSSDNADKILNQFNKLN